MTNAKLADEIDGGYLRVSKVLNGTHIEYELSHYQLRQIIAALRQPSETLKAAYFEGYEDALKDRQPSSDKVLVPREPTRKMMDAGYAAAAFPRDPEICIAMYRAMLSAAEAARLPKEEGKCIGLVDKHMKP